MTYKAFERGEEDEQSAVCQKGTRHESGVVPTELLRQLGRSRRASALPPWEVAEGWLAGDTPLAAERGARERPALGYLHDVIRGLQGDEPDPGAAESVDSTRAPAPPPERRLRLVRSSDRPSSQPPRAARSDQETRMDPDIK